MSREQIYQIVLPLIIGSALIISIVFFFYFLVQFLRQLNLKKYISKRNLLIASSIIPLAIVLIAGFFTVSSQPSFCNLCHVIEKDYRTWRKSSHKEVTCLACHQERGAIGFITKRLEGTRNLTRWILNSYQRPIIAQVRDEACQRCHRKETAKGIIRSQAIRVSHKEIIKAGYRCIDCHNTVAHGKAVPVGKYPTMDKCAVCHNGEIASKDCRTCHTKKVKLIRAKNLNNVWAITHGKRWKKLHGMGNLATCQMCHPKDYCRDCHGGLDLPHPSYFPAQHGKFAKEDRKRCLECHRVDFCSSCHKTEMPHPLGFLPTHSKQTKKLGESFCLRCHIKYDCNACHERHVHPGLAFD